MALIAGMVLLIAVPVLVTQAGAALPTPPTFNFVLDENGKDDQPGQKDLSAQAVATPAPGELWTSWLWDVTSLSGGNTGDACSLFDTDTDGKVNFAVCVTIEKNPAVQAAVSPRVYTCGDGKVDRCTSTYTEVPKLATECETNTNATDPFHAGQKDTQAICKIDLAAVGGPGTANLVNVCSYPSQTPTSDPSDCVLIPRDAFIVIRKIADPNTTGTQFPFRLGPSADATNPVEFTATNSQTSNPIPIRSGINYRLKEDIPTNWAIDGTPSCTGASGTGASNGTFVSPDTINTIKAASDNVITCTFNDKQLTGAIRITKQRTGTTIKLNGAHFTVDGSGDYVTGSGTNATGTVCIEGLVLGTHTVTETIAPNGHSKANPASQSVNVNTAGTCASGAKDVTFNNPLVPGSITVNKFDLANNRLAGATFELRVDNPTVGVYNAGVDTATGIACTPTGTTGQCTFANVQPGNYVVVETSPPPGYNAIGPKFVTVNVGSAEDTGDHPSVRFDDPPAAGSITVKKSGHNEAALNGAVFRLYKDTVAPFGAPVSLGDLDTGLTCETGDTVAGQCVFNDIAPGEYILKEITTPDGYTTHADVAVTVPIGTTPGSGANVLVEIENTAVNGRINIKKKGYNNANLAGATFTLYYDDPVIGTFSAQTDDPVGKTCTTDANGECHFADLEPDRDYIAVETTTPNGYDTADPQGTHIGIGQEDPNGQPNEGDTDTLTFVDPVVPGTVTINKTSDAGSALDGATFTLYTDAVPGNAFDDSVDLPTTMTCVTVAGTCNITQVPLGDYWIVETDAPDGYDAADPKPIHIGVGDEAPHVGDAVTESFVNARQHRVVVIVCHEGSDTLFSRDVKVGNVTKQSLAAGSLTPTQQAQICDTGGASFGNISGHGKVTAEVDLNSGP